MCLNEIIEYRCRNLVFYQRLTSETSMRFATCLLSGSCGIVSAWCYSQQYILFIGPFLVMKTQLDGHNEVPRAWSLATENPGVFLVRR